MIDGPVELQLPGEPVVFSFWPPDPTTDPIISRYTGKPLRRIEYNLGVRGDSAHEQLEAAIDAAARGDALISDASGSRWEVTEHSISWQEGQAVTMYTHDVKFAEHEELDLQRVEFQGLVITPDRSLPKSDDQRISWWLLATLDPEQHQQFERVWERQATEGTEPLFPVRLVGISGDPVQMRLGRCLWQPLDGGAVRHRIVLIGEGNDVDDDGPFDLLHQPELSRSIEQSAITTTTLHALIDELQRAGVLAADVIDRLRGISTINDVPFAVSRELDRTRDIDKYFD